MYFFCLPLLLLMLLTTIAAHPAQQGCNANNCLRALRNPRNSDTASFFCSDLLPPTSTVTINHTITATHTFTNLFVQPLTTIFTTVTLTTFATTTFTRTHIIPTPPSTTSSVSHVPRDYDPAPTATPAFFSACEDEPNKISSACSCFLTSVAPAIVTQVVTITIGVFGGTSTLPTETVTSDRLVTSTGIVTVTLYEP